MSIQSFSEQLLSNIDKAFEKEANSLLNEARNENKHCPRIAGKMDGFTESVKIIKETYKLFVTEEKESDEDESKPLY